MPHRLDCKNISRYLLLGANPIKVATGMTSQADLVNKEKMISTRRKLVEPDVDTDEAPVGDDVRRWPDAAGSPSPDSVRRSYISFKPKEPRYLRRSSSSAGQRGRTTGLSRPPLRTGLRGLVDDEVLSRFLSGGLAPNPQGIQYARCQIKTAFILLLTIDLLSLRIGIPSEIIGRRVVVLCSAVIKPIARPASNAKQFY